MIHLLKHQNEVKLLESILTFDRIADQPSKKLYIRAHTESTKESYLQLGYFLKARNVEPPEKLPDNSILTVDIGKLDPAQLEEWRSQVLLLIALKYATHQ